LTSILDRMADLNYGVMHGGVVSSCLLRVGDTNHAHSCIWTRLFF